MTVGAWLATSWIPSRPSWSAGIRSMLHFGGTITLNGLVIHIAYNFDRFILGRVWGADALGYYGVASQLINIPTSNLNMAVGGVAFSALSRLQNDAVRFSNYFLKGYALNVSLTLPITIFLGVFAKDIISVVLGPKWIQSVAIFQLLAPAVLVFGIINPLGWLLWPIGKHVRSLQIALAISVLVITGCLIGLTLWPPGRGGWLLGSDGDLAAPACRVDSARDDDNPLGHFAGDKSSIDLRLGGTRLGLDRRRFVGLVLDADFPARFGLQRYGDQLFLTNGVCNGKGLLSRPSQSDEE